ncbi:hypothetical protein BGX29_008513, partial [Mortierella sp. GBA35]
MCAARNGTRLVGMSYTSRHNEPKNTFPGATNHTHIMLITSNPSPSSIHSILWSLVSAQKTNITYPTDFSPMACHVDPATGVFTMMSNYTQSHHVTSDSGALVPRPPPNSDIPLRPPGGFQYDPRTDRWSSFRIRPGYGWSDVYIASFALFAWPNTTTFYHVYVNEDRAGTGVGMLDSSTNEFVNVATWKLDVNIHGYPLRFAYGDGVIYQIGSVIFNNGTGTTVLTRIPLSGTNGSTFVLPTNLTTYEASSLGDCLSDTTSLSFYNRVLYIFCKHAQDADTLFVSEFKDGAIRDPKVSTERFAKVPDARNGIQVISATTEHEADPWGLYFNTVGDRSIAGEVRLRWISSGRVDQTDRPMSVSAAFGDEDRPPDLPSSDTKPLAGSTIGLLVGGIALVAGMSFFVCIRFVRPRYRARRKEKKSGPGSGSSFSTVAEDRDWKDGEVGFGEDSNNNYIGDKFEATSEY